ncbi:ABC transporter permease [Amycolatopsis nalaikhensis]|uniref:Transport permease protein n=1 Tax=Amycolatopsis nalaikhensis TaxID=715472 RepID=A0ABY8XAT0_9PSEU|nr:ABC transporter permease [Amycolatopsis sp. 2-2]WIV53527.1 ABC transporter permease [Amycolatopsis sp. 2-2]
MAVLTKLTAAEAKVFLRDPGAPAIVAGIPLALLLVFGLMPDANQPDPKYGGHSPLATVIAPMAVTILLAMLALTQFPNAMGTYREKGLLKRLSASPVPPSRLLAAQLLVNLAAAVVVVLLVAVVGKLALGIALPGNPAGFLVSIVLGALALFSVGLLVAALAPTGRAASGIGAALLFPMLALGGVWVPKEQLPPVLQHVADVLPLGATLNALRATWAGDAPEALQLGAMAAFAVVCTAVAARVFRWE